MENNKKRLEMSDLTYDQRVDYKSEDEHFRFLIPGIETVAASPVFNTWEDKPSYQELLIEHLQAKPSKRYWSRLNALCHKFYGTELKPYPASEWPDTLIERE